MKVDLSRKAMIMRLLYIVAGFIMFKVYRESYPKGTNDRNEKIVFWSILIIAILSMFN
jgi:uncharacterized membrane-anchored protein